MQQTRVERRHEAGTVMIFVVIAMLSLLGFASFAIDGGNILNTKAQLQHAADAGALAAIGAIRDGQSRGLAKQQGRAVAESHVAGNAQVALNGSDITVGTFDFSSTSFTPGAGGTGVMAVRVGVNRDASSGAGPLQLFLGQVVGLSSVNVRASATAAVRRRDIVLVQDRTFSFVAEFPDAIIADEALVNAMSGSMALPGDRMGLVTFSRVSQEHTGLVSLAGNASNLTSTIQSFQVCQNASAASGCNGTGTADGVNEARKILNRDSTAGDAEKVIVILTDGQPCYVEYPNPTAQARLDAIQAVDDALNDGISVFVITLAITPPPGSHVCMIPDEAFNNSLARGFGFGIATPVPSDLDDLLVSIIRQMPARLVD